MRCGVGWVELRGDRQMLNGFLQIPAFLKYLVAESIAAEEALRILGDHLTERINVHSTCRSNLSGTITLKRPHRLYENEAERNSSGTLQGSGGVGAGTVERVGKVVDGRWVLTVTVRIPGPGTGALLAR